MSVVDVVVIVFGGHMVEWARLIRICHIVHLHSVLRDKYGKLVYIDLWGLFGSANCAATNLAPGIQLGIGRPTPSSTSYNVTQGLY